jgi:hypothetical protein
MRYLKFFESYLDPNELKSEINEFLNDNHYYIDPARLVELIIDKLGLDEEDISDETTRDNCVIIKLKGVDFVKVYLTRDFVYDYGKNSVNFRDRFYFNEDLLQ